MPKIAYLQCPTGIAGDMCLGALVHAGVPLDYLISQLGRLEIASEFQLGAELVQRNSQQATKFHVTLTNNQDPNDYTSVNSAPLAIDQEHNHQDFIHDQQHDHAHSDQSFHQHDHAHSQAHSYSQTNSHSHSQTHNNSHDHSHSHDHAVHTKSPHNHQPHRHLPEITEIIKKAKLPARVEAWSLAIFQKLAEAEGAVHGVPPEQVHFHEVGATDAIVDIVGTCLGLDWLNIEQLYCSPLPTGGGTIWAAHGRLAVPVPAVLRLWQIRQVPVYSNGIEKELCTPTGVAIACTLATSFG
ncbi:MAG: LarC family nickel insertion protein, partial [Microcoleaceae cyanobacterium]